MRSLDFQVPHLQPMHNIISNIIYATNGSDVHSLIVNGNLLMHKRQVLTLNESEILNETEGKLQELFQGKDKQY